MKKKILIICAVVVVTAVVLCGVLGVCLNLKDKPIFKTEIDGIVYEMDYDYYSARNDLTLNNDEYKYSILTEVKLSIKNNNSVQFSFQPQLFSLDIGNGYICDFESVKNTATNEIITDKNEVITITAGSQIVFEFTFRGEIEKVGTINSKEESVKKKIENQINTNKQTFSEVEKFSLDLVNTKIAEFSAYIEYDSAKQLFDSANGI